MSAKGAMSPEERQALAQKLDTDLDKFMDELAAKNNNNESENKDFNFDEWCKDIDRHPAFAKELRPDGENCEYSAEIQALQALKYDEEDPAECAVAHKEEGNRHFKQRHYRWAIEAYTKGIKLCCTDRPLNSVLYANRAAANRRLGNMRSAVRDCMFACRFDPNNVKAAERCAECLLELGAASKCIEWIEQMAAILDKSEDEKQRRERIDELKAKATEMRRREERDARKQRAMKSAEQRENQALLEALKERAVVLQPPVDDVDDLARLNVQLDQLDEHVRVRLCPETGSLIWPLLLQYPQMGLTDFVAQCAEHLPLDEVLAEIFASPASWDPDHIFCAQNVRLFVSLDIPDDSDEQIREVLPDQHSLGQVLRWPHVIVRFGLPVLQVYTKDHLVGKKLKRVSELDRIFRFK